MDILVTGATGMVGPQLVDALRQDGHALRVLSRHPQSAARDGVRAFGWDPAAEHLDDDALDGVDAVVHLAGENIAGGRWTEERKRRLRDSRVDSTRLLAQRIADRPSGSRPSVLVSASAVGFWGDRGDELLHDDSPPGDGFLAELSLAWESAADPARDAGLRVVHPRIGVVLDRSGGALAKMLLPFRLGLGGVIGSGRQWMSWISLPDLVSVLRAAVTRQTQPLSGAVAAVAPQAVTNKTFTRTLGRVLRRPTILPLPAFAARLALGEMADHLLLASAQVEPRKLLQAGHEFTHPHLEDALRATLRS